LPVGNLTSQWFANLYLDGLDHYVASGLGVGSYVRYCDDFILLADGRARLKDARAAMRAYLDGLRLRIHEERAQVTPVRAGARFVGFRLWPTHRIIRKENVRDFRRRIKDMKRRYAAGELDCRDIEARLAGWLGHAGQANSKRLVERLSRDGTFAGGGAEIQYSPMPKEKRMGWIAPPHRRLHEYHYPDKNDNRDDDIKRVVMLVVVVCSRPMPMNPDMLVRLGPNVADMFRHACPFRLA
jgi:hypothetical protein